jgi:hypothetical protein
MKRRFGAALLMAARFGLVSADAAPAPDSVDAHVLAAQKAAGLDFPGSLEVLCIQPADGSDAEAAARAGAAARPRAIPARESWYAGPAKVFDNVYWVGTKINSSWAIKTDAGIILIDTMYNYAAETEIVQGLKKLGLDPATIKYVIVSHGHGDHDEGAKMLQDKYGARIIMGAPDWDSIIKANNMPGAGPHAGHPVHAVSGKRQWQDTRGGIFRRNGVQLPPRSGAVRSLYQFGEEIFRCSEGRGRHRSSVQPFDVRSGLDQESYGEEARRRQPLCGWRRWRAALFHRPKRMCQGRETAAERILMSCRHQLKAASLRDEKISDYPIVGEGVALVADLSDRSVCRVPARKFARELVW